jgi:hypothetical protein
MTLTRPPRTGRLVLLLGALGIAACDIPSEPPIFQQTWLVPADSVQVSVAELLPDSVAFNGDSSAFIVTTPTAAFNTTLGDLCGDPACQVPGDVAVPNTPAFSSAPGDLTSTISLPGDVSSIMVSGGSLQLQVTNDLGFDPLRPNGAGSAPYGSISIEITAGALNTTTTINGTPAVGMPDGAMSTFNVPLPLGSYTGDITIEVVISAPQGGAATVNSTNPFAVAASVQNLAISSASVTVNAQSVTNDATEFDLEDVDLEGVVEGGGVVLTVVNPFNMTASLNLTFAAPAQGGEPAVNIVKGFNMAASTTSVVNLTLLKSELESLLGKSGVTVTVGGTATGTGPGNTVTVTPSSTITVRTQMSLTLNVGA